MRLVAKAADFRHTAQKVTELACCAHIRRMFFDYHHATQSANAYEVLERIRSLQHRHAADDPENSPRSAVRNILPCWQTPTAFSCSTSIGLIRHLLGYPMKPDRSFATSPDRLLAPHTGRV
ncbi:MAG: IS66 family transposase [Rhodanobacter sp.]|nr:IS66 family transposase [Rhodanobacter sp.]